eukprot:jgi/Chlat1/3470/Chrsp23S03667
MAAAAAAAAALEAAWPVRVKADLPGGRGRGLVAARALKAGETVLRELPTLLVTTQRAAASTCARCCRQPDPHPSSILPLPCPGPCAGAARYCCDACLDAHALHHRPLECAALGALVNDRNALEGEEETDEGRFLVAAVALKERSRQQDDGNFPPKGPTGFFDGCSREVLPPGGFAALERLYDPASVAQETSVTPEQRRVYEAVAEAVGREKVTEEEAASLLRKDRCNSYGIMARSSPSGDRDIRASGVYASAALLNHDCLPNVCRFDRFDDPTCGPDSNTVVEIRAMHDVVEGTELVMSYFPINQTYAQRQRRLKEEYGFDCACQRCQVESAWSDEEEEEDGGHAAGDGAGGEVGVGSSKTQQANGAEQDEGEVDDAEANNDQDEDDGVDDFPHMMFFARYLCPSDSCGGTLCPEEGTYHERDSPRGDAFWDRYDYVESGVMECNMCGRKRTEEEFVEEMARLREEGDEEEEEEEEGYAEIESDASH